MSFSPVGAYLHDCFPVSLFPFPHTAKRALTEERNWLFFALKKEILFETGRGGTEKGATATVSLTSCWCTLTLRARRAACVVCKRRACLARSPVHCRQQQRQGRTERASPDACAKLWQSIETQLLKGQKLQGTLTCQELYQVLQHHGLVESFPLFACIYDIAFQGRPVADIVQAIRIPSRL